MVFDLSKVKNLMQEKGIDCIIATSRENVFYSSRYGSGGGLRLAPVFLPLGSEPVILVHPSGSGAGEDIMARRTTWIDDVRTYQGGEWAPLEIWRIIADVIKEKKLQAGKIGLEVLHVPGLCYDYIKELLPSAEFVECESIFNEMRSVKSSEELKILSDANMATAKAITMAFENAKPGDTEKQIARKIKELMMDYGASRTGFMLLAAGPYIVEPHHSAGDYKIKEGDMIHVDGGAIWKGYGSDISRMAVVGEPSEKQLKAYNVIITQMWDTAEAMQNGVTVKEVHNAAKKSYESQTGMKYPRFFIGHSKGISGHEHPIIGPFHGDWVLEPDMFFQLEPSHVASKDIRVHYEDSFIVQKTGPAKNVSEFRDSWKLQVIK